MTDDFETTPAVELTLPEPRTINMIRVREDIRLGQRAESIGACRLWRIDGGS